MNRRKFIKLAMSALIAAGIRPGVDGHDFDDGITSLENYPYPEPEPQRNLHSFGGWFKENDGGEWEFNEIKAARCPPGFFDGGIATCVFKSGPLSDGVIWKIYEQTRAMFGMDAPDIDTALAIPGLKRLWPMVGKYEPGARIEMWLNK